MDKEIFYCLLLQLDACGLVQKAYYIIQLCGHDLCFLTSISYSFRGCAVYGSISCSNVKIKGLLLRSFEVCHVIHARYCLTRSSLKKKKKEIERLCHVASYNLDNCYCKASEQTDVRFLISFGSRESSFSGHKLSS